MIKIAVIILVIVIIILNIRRSRIKYYKDKLEDMNSGFKNK
jgi:hypothetical protein